MTPQRLSTLLILLPTSLLLCHSIALAQGAPVIDRTVGKEMLGTIKQTVKESYYDPNFHGMDLDSRFKRAEAQIDKATSTWQIHAIIAEVLVDLDDSHTFFLPPELVVGVDFGFDLQMIGDTCYVTKVKSKSDAESKGLKAGDVLYSIEGFEPTRDSLWKIHYSYFILLPPPSMRLTVRDPKGTLKNILVQPEKLKNKTRTIDFNETVDPETRPTCSDLSPDTLICRLPSFDISDGAVDDMMKRIRSSKSLILDLRGNAGGKLSTEQRLVGHFFDREVKIGDLKERKKTSTLMAKTRGPNKIFQGKLIVLVDSNSGSAAEVFARIVQLEKRGTVVGDRTAGAVMTSQQIPFPLRSAAAQVTRFSFYGVSITIADLIMSDGKSLEKTGVMPDLAMIPTGEDLATERDPVLAHAASLAGVTIDSQKAGAVFKELSKAEKKK